MVVSDISEGGVALALSELCIVNKLGMKINFLKNKKQPEKILFCEDQSRYILIVNNKRNLKALLEMMEFSSKILELSEENI